MTADSPWWRGKGDYVARFAKFCQNAAIVVGAVVAGVTFLSSEHDKRVQAVLALRTEFASRVYKDYLKLMSDWDNFPDANAIAHATDAEQKRIIENFFAKNENKDRLLSIADFFDTLSACIDQGACDRNTAIYLFQNSANQVFQISGYHVEKVRNDDGDPNFAKGLESMYRLESQNFLRGYL
jgi:hypothetical protein